MTYLITLSLEKGVIVLEKSLEKVLNFGSKICINPPNPNPHFWIFTSIFSEFQSFLLLIYVG